MNESLTSLALGHEATSRVLKKYRLDPAKVFHDAGLDAEPYRDPDSRVRLAAVKKLWELCATLTNNPCIGFEIGMAVLPANLHALGHAWLASHNLREGLARIARYHRLVSTAVDVRLVEHAAELEVLIAFSPAWPQEPIDACVVGLVTLCRHIASDAFRPLCVQMTRAQPPCAKELARFFGCPTQYGQDCNRVAFRRSEVEELLPRHNPSLARASDEVALDYIARMDRGDVLSRAKLELIDMLTNGEPTRNALAHRLHMSERTLGRRLRDKGVTFRELLDDVRKELGLGYMAEARYAVTDVAYLLGFSDQSNFARSFRRWTGSTPTEYRSAHQ